MIGEGGGSWGKGRERDGHCWDNNYKGKRRREGQMIGSFTAEGLLSQAPAPEWSSALCLSIDLTSGSAEAQE